MWSCGHITPTSLVDRLVTCDREIVEQEEEQEEREGREIDNVDLDYLIDSDDELKLICFVLLNDMICVLSKAQ